MSKLNILSALLASLLLPGMAYGEMAAKEAQAFVESHCVRCHGAEKQKGKFRMDTVPLEAGAKGFLQPWGMALDKVPEAMRIFLEESDDSRS